MAQATISQAGSFSDDDINSLNANFTDLYVTVPATVAAAAVAARAPVAKNTAGALSLTANGNRITTVNSAAGIALTLPAATGTGNEYRVYIGTTITSIGTTITTAGSDKIWGQAFQTGAAGAITAFYTAGGSITTLNGSTTGGIKGDYIVYRDIGSALWSVTLMGSITSTAATPFS